MPHELLFKVEQVVRPLLEQLGLRLVEREYGAEEGRWILRLSIDRLDATAVTIADCQKASGVLGPAIEVAELMQRSYSLEVSSPGVDRPLRDLQDFQRFAGEEVKLRTTAPLNGRSNFRGQLRGIAGEEIVMHIDGVDYAIPHHLLLKARVIGKVEMAKKKIKH